MNRATRTTLSLITASMVVLGCSGDDDDDDAPVDPVVTPVPPGGNPEPPGTGGDTRTYDISLTNLTGGQPLSAPAVIVHAPAERFWSVGAAATEALERLAESGDSAGIAALPAATDGAFADGASPIDPGTSSSIRVSVDAADATSLTVISRLGFTDDGFTGVDAIDLSALTVDGESLVIDRWAYDAGTRANLEGDDLGSFDPARPSGPDGSAGSEFAHVSVHPGVLSDGEPVPGNTSRIDASRKFDNPVVRVRVTRVAAE